MTDMRMQAVHVPGMAGVGLVANPCADADMVG